MDAVANIFNAHSRTLATLASIVLVILISVTVANTVLFFVEHIEDESIAPDPVNVSRTAEPKPRIDIAGLNLFGVVAEAPAAAPVVVDAPETRLNLELQGIFTSDDADLSTAIVAQKGKAGELFGIGDRLPGNAILEAVHEDHILIKRGGRVEKLTFEDAAIRSRFASQRVSGNNNASARLATPSASATDASRLENIRERIAQRRQEAASRFEATRDGGASSSGPSIREQVSRYRERIRENPDAVLNELGVSPVSAGEAQGYRIGGNLPEAALQQAGLRQGDVILSVNGRPVGNVANDQAMIDQAMSSGRVRVEVQRADRRFFLTVPIPN